jgi:hypothetical protein
MLICKIKQNQLEAPGYEPGAFRMPSGHSTTELCPLYIQCDLVITNYMGPGQFVRYNRGLLKAGNEIYTGCCLM